MASQETRGRGAVTVEEVLELALRADHHGQRNLANRLYESASRTYIGAMGTGNDHTAEGAKAAQKLCLNDPAWF